MLEDTDVIERADTSGSLPNDHNTIRTNNKATAGHQNNVATQELQEQQMIFPEKKAGGGPLDAILQEYNHNFLASDDELF